MEKKLLIVSSITYAIKGQEILNKNGFYATLKRISKSKRTPGCGYGIIVNKDFDRAKRILMENGIKILDNPYELGTEG